MASLVPPRRRFDNIEHVVHEKLPFSIVKTLHSQSSVFKGNVYDRIERRRILAEFEEHGDESYHETRCTLKDILYDEGQENVDGLQNVVVSLVLVGVNSMKNSYWCELMPVIHFVSIPNNVEELCKECFYQCKSLSRVTFGESSSLKLIGVGAFRESGVCEIHIPDGV